MIQLEKENVHTTEIAAHRELNSKIPPVMRGGMRDIKNLQGFRGMDSDNIKLEVIKDESDITTRAAKDFIKSNNSDAFATENDYIEELRDGRMSADGSLQVIKPTNI